MFDHSMAVELDGTTDMLVHNVRLSNPVDEYVLQLKELTSIRKKTDEDHAKISKLEFFGGMYVNTIKENGNTRKECVCPGKNLKRCLQEGAKKFKLGKKVLNGVFIFESPVIEHDGPTDPDQLWADPRFRLTCPVGNQSNKILRTRPRFINWRLAFRMEYDPEEIDKRDLQRSWDEAGKRGLNDYRPLYGRFIASFPDAENDHN